MSIIEYDTAVSTEGGSGDLSDNSLPSGGGGAQPNPSKLQPPVPFHIDCPTFAAFEQKKWELERAGYTYFGNTKAGNNDGWFTEFFMQRYGVVPHEIYQRYAIDDHHGIEAECCFLKEQGETIVTTSGWHSRTGEELEGQAVFIKTKKPTVSMTAFGKLIVTETALTHPELAILRELRGIAAEYCESFDLGNSGTARELRIPWGYALKDRTRLVEDLRQLDRLLAPEAGKREDKARMKEQMKELIGQLLESMERSS